MLLGIGILFFLLFLFGPLPNKSHTFYITAFPSKRPDPYSQSRPVHDGTHYLTDVNCC